MEKPKNLESKNYPIEIERYSIMPIKAIPAQTLKGLETPLQIYISDLLNLKADSARQLKLNIPVLLDLCRMISLKEVKKMMELYVDGKLGFQPMPNYFDRILLGRITEAYRVYNKQIKSKDSQFKKDSEKIAKEQKENADFMAVVSYFDNVVQGYKMEEAAVWVYSYLVDYKRVVQFSKEDRIEAYNNFIDKGYSKDEAIVKSKLELLTTYFLIMHGKDLHIKNLIK